MVTDYFLTFNCLIMKNEEIHRRLLVPQGRREVLKLSGMAVAAEQDYLAGCSYDEKQS
jgi:hypothetical protein